jgi:PhoH-like ATPase
MSLNPCKTTNGITQRQAVFELELPEDSYLNEYFIVRTSENGCESIMEPVRNVGEGRIELLPLYRQHLRQEINKGDKNGLQMPGGVRVIARNIEQWMHMDAVMNPDISLITCIGKAGTGKTFIAMAVAMHELLSDHNHYEKLLISRPVVETR